MRLVIRVVALVSCCLLPLGPVLASPSDDQLEREAGSAADSNLDFDVDGRTEGLTLDDYNRYQTEPPPSGHDHWSGLPLWSSLAEGHDLPLPLGVGLNFHFQSQDFELSELEIGIDGASNKIPIDFLDFTQVETSTENYNLRVDAWVLPFLSVYGLVGYTRGEAKGEVTVPLSAPLPTFTLPFEDEYEGITYGGGVTLAGGYEFLFASVDANFTLTSLDSVDEPTTAGVFSVRVGVHGELFPWLGGAVWGGLMYQDVDQVIEGEFDIGDGLPPISYKIREEPEDPLNYLIGGSVDLSDHFSLILEAGLGNRQSFLATLDFRF